MKYKYIFFKKKDSHLQKIQPGLILQVLPLGPVVIQPHLPPVSLKETKGIRE
jgi:hypothetical protein